jgi:hypothetical protein
VVLGSDRRETFNDGFDLLQSPRGAADGTFGADTCANAGGLDQNIYGTLVTFP